MITLLIVVALLLLDLYAASRGGSAGRLLFTLAAVALLIALLGPAIALLRLPLGQFLLLWLFIIPITLIAAVALTLAGLARRAATAATPSSVSRRVQWLRRALIALALGLIAAVALANLALPLRLIGAPIQGVETSTGAVVGGVRYGAAFVGTARGGTAGTFTASVNYRPALPNPGATSSIVGGSWSLAVYQGNHYRGTLFGALTRGTIAWNLDVTAATITADLTVAGGMGDYLAARGHGHFVGTLLHLTFPPTIAGTLTLATH